ncbi:MAG: MFS transporter [Candidatus Atabeyarchaeum deiterrae]
MAKKKPDKAQVATEASGRVRTLTTISYANMVNAGDTQLVSNLWPQIMGSTINPGPAALGGMFTASRILQSVTAPAWGWWSDRYSRRRILSIGCFIWAVFTIMTGLASQSIDLLVWQLLMGVGLAVIVPTTQSLVADYYPPQKRGKAFGILGLAGLLGAIFGTIFATGVAGLGEITLLGLTIESWRFVLFTWGLLSLFTGVVVLLFAKDPLRGGLEPELTKVLTQQKAERYKVKRSDYKKILTNRTFVLILVQGVAGSIPWTGLLFLITWLQYVGFESLTSGIILAFMILGTAMGNLFGGLIGDRAARWRPRSGRILIAQISVFSGIPMTYVMFLLIPMRMDSIILYTLAGAFTGFLISWCSNACNSPIFSEIFEPEIRSTVYSVDTMIEGSAGAIGTLLVGALAEIFFGYKPVPPNVVISTLPEAIRIPNALALSNAMFLTAFIPWTLCLIFYTFVYKTYPRDIEKMRKKLERRGKELER